MRRDHSSSFDEPSEQDSPRQGQPHRLDGVSRDCLFQEIPGRPDHLSQLAEGPERLIERLCDGSGWRELSVRGHEKLPMIVSSSSELAGRPEWEVTPLVLFRRM